jgi:subtilisin-like proprotein convertase family protein
VAGVCGLVLSANPLLTALEVKRLLEQTADKDLSLQTDTPVNEPGNFDANGFSLWFGHGKVNAFRAVEAAASAAAEANLVDVEERPNLRIPDVGAPVVSSIDIDERGSIVEMRVQVDISHTYISDLRVDLIAPDSTGVVLHNHTGGSANDLIKTYSAQETPALRALEGKPIGGTWRLQVRDTFRLDVGRLNRWRIVARVVGASPRPAIATSLNKDTRAKKSRRGNHEVRQNRSAV